MFRQEADRSGVDHVVIAATLHDGVIERTGSLGRGQFHHFVWSLRDRASVE
ncbi:hypothetical protein [Rhodococcus sp. WMMA185]|uniref:hypothetical protein n=1 Tax=Rhodococcus sp. WMMA185 TaxID=679318 RepID=UPI0012F5157F|nr:hypothetical protein [Rhodococcus sp. WMMA185]